MDRIDAIYQRHVAALARIGIEQDAVRLSLRLALEEMGEGREARSEAGDMAAVQLHRLYTWLISHADGRGEGMEIADAMIAVAEDRMNTIRSLTFQIEELHERLRQEARHVISAERMAGLPVLVTVEEATNSHANGAGPLDDQTVTDLRADGIWAIRASAWLQDTDIDWLEGLERGAHTFRSVPKDVRRRLVQAHIDTVRTDSEAPRQFDFDQSRPAWMPSAGSVTATFGMSWGDLCAAKDMP